MARRRARIEPQGKDEDVRLMAGMITAGVVTIVLIASMLIAPPADVGPEEGSLAPDFVADAYTGSTWEEVRLSELYDGRLIYINFLDTDCPYCWEEGEELSQMHEAFKDDVRFINVMVSLEISGHDSSRAEVEAFRDKTSFGDNENNGDGCYSGRKNCAERPGDPHTWTYVDDLSNSIAKDWDLPGTPFSVILDSSGTVIWNQAQPENHPSGEDVGNALARFLGGN